MYVGRLNPLWIFLLFLGLFRVTTLGLYPLMDTTEARYGEMGRIMAETGNWLLPQIDYGVPFWGKPPLSFWASAASISLFGNSEFFLRLPHFAAAMLTLVLVWRFVRALEFGREEALIAVAIVASTVGFLLVAGALMTDMLLTLALTLALTGFWRGWHGESRQIYLMYAGFGLGLLAKGPLVLVLGALTIVPWIIATRGFRAVLPEMYGRLRLPGGIAMMLLIAAPWYLLMERESPGFLEYFVLGEHFKRFLVSGWQGDLYGSAHAHPRGTIWLYWIIFALPWSVLLTLAGARAIYRRRFELLRDPLALFLLLWMCCPGLLFSLAGNVLPAYIAPGLPALGPLILVSFDRSQLHRGRPLLLAGPALMLALVLVFVFFAANIYSEKGLLQAGIDQPYPVIYHDHLPYSARYYTNGEAKKSEAFPAAETQPFYYVTRKKDSHQALEAGCRLLAENRKRAIFVCHGERTS